jgi:carbon storage regulator
MLVLSRKVGERILVGEQIRITVVRLTHGGVRLGIEAPDGTTVIREELIQKRLDTEQPPRQAADMSSTPSATIDEPATVQRADKTPSTPIAGGPARR